MPVAAQSAPPAAQSGPQEVRPASQPALHWAPQIGHRTWQVTLATKVIDRVALVPDAATYLDQVRKWSPAGRWPVLFEDDVLAPMFVRRFKPAEVIRCASVAAGWPDDRADRRAALESAVIHALGGDPHNTTLTQLFNAANYRPPGVVVASTSDPSWPAALALAIGHAQPLVWIDDDFGPLAGEMDDATIRQLAGAIETALTAMPWTWRTLGDDIETITLCRNLPVAARINLPDSLRLITQGQYADGTIAVSDFIGRHADGSRFTFTGWVFGDEQRSAYMAMCSLFLPDESIALLNTYNDDGEWGQYGMSEAADLFTRGQFAIEARKGPAEMGDAGWARLLVGGLSSDAIWMNSGGNDDFFILNGGQARPGDVPVLNHPAAVHLIHSWSLRKPWQRATVGGRWLDHGSYAMVGSCFEPFLSTFVQPRMLAARCLGGVPFLVAARHWPDDQRSKPWRIVTIGDPLMLILPRQATAPPGFPQRIAPAPAPATPLSPVIDGENLIERARALMKSAAETNDRDQFAQAIRTLELIGRDDLAVQMWTLAQQQGVISGRAASAAMGPLFRSHDAAAFMQAWNAGGPRSPLHSDMLWQLLGPRLGGTIARDELTTLESAVRPDLPSADVERLAPHVLRVSGQARLRTFFQKQIDAAASDPEQQRAIREIAGRY